jgi:hypothetical protein
MYILYLFIFIIILKVIAQYINNNEELFLFYYDKIKSVYYNILDKIKAYRSTK